jgi:hypothetical protein
MTLRIRVYAGFDWRSKSATKIVKEASLILASHYGIHVNVDVIELPYNDLEASSAGLPQVVIEGRTVVRGRIPHIDEVIDACFDVLEERFEKPWYLVPLGHKEREKGLLGV